MTIGWVLLVASGVVDVGWGAGDEEGGRVPGARLGGSVLVLLAIFVALLTKALQVLPIGTAYAVWTGIGAVGSVAAGIVLFGEPADAIRLLFAAVTVLGVAGLKLAG